MRDKNAVTIEKSIRTASLIDGFWERWLVHGIDPIDLSEIRPRLINLDDWVENWSHAANKKARLAEELKRKGSLVDAEFTYRTAGLYYNLAQWIFPDRCQEKERLFSLCNSNFDKADQLSIIETMYPSLEIDHKKCTGRARTPKNPKGCIIIINPIDSSKEELFLYERDFLDSGYATISFDGPGQGETFVRQGLKATQSNWEYFIDRVIEHTATFFPTVPLFLFGTSLGASWVVYGSCNRKIEKALAVSPAFARKQIKMPDYFTGRMDCVLGDGKEPVPDFEQLNYRSPIFLVHGRRDAMVQSSDIYRLYGMLPDGKRLIEYQEEMHCCNNKLSEIRQLATQWYMSDHRMSI
ncbi:alpha/beta hydrolase [Alicyclobacillus fastidiosus]|uniref:Alpha/beta hydrolase n=1 Tax=Alicyclobacillus fastidiosus TaxID=392011 RepID=A0ABV5AID1_9BACL|nr:alpha/beta hydrolase [Alicyclobacillus fastidiosus]WEH10102.1 alpha/beta hydrolase [Alicyclobacillus fastidiosus]